MKNALIIILYDHPSKHTADYSMQAGKFFCKNNTVIGVLLKDSRSIREILQSFTWTRIWKRETKNFYTYTPIYLIPFRRYKYICHLNNLLNMLLLKAYLYIYSILNIYRVKMIWVFNPEHYDEALLLKGTGFQMVYDCVDFHSTSRISLQEKYLISQSNFIFVNSSVLYNLFHKIRSDIHVVPLGFDYEIFRSTKLKKTPHTENSPIIGYVGGINSRLDFNLLQGIITQCPQYTFIFIGPVQIHEEKKIFDMNIRPKIDALFRNSNVQYLGAIPKKHIGKYIQWFSICMIPYTITTPFNKNCFPMKVLEYFYFGKPVISTPIQELKKYSQYIFMGKSSLEWMQYLEYLSDTDWENKIQKEQRDIAISNSWDKKFQKILTIIQTSHA